MKYIIEIENEYTKDWVNETPMCKELCMPISVQNRHRTYHVATGFKLEPYTEPSQKAIDLQHAHDIENVARMNYNKGAEDAWEFAKEVRLKEFIDEEGRLHGYISSFNSYSEAKAKHEELKKQEDEIRVGDEVIYDSRTKAVVVIPETEERYGTILTGDFATIVVSHDDLEKTGRHFDDIAELLKKMGDEK